MVYRFLVLKSTTQFLNFSPWESLSKSFTLYLCHTLSNLAWALSSLHYLFRGKMERSASPFYDLRYVFNYSVNIVWETNLKIHEQITPTLLKPINCLSPVWLQNRFKAGLLNIMQSSQGFNERENLGSTICCRPSKFFKIFSQ